MGALHCVTDNHMHIYTAQTSGEVKDMRHPLRFRTSTRGFDTTVEQQQAVSRPCPRNASAEEAGWHQARVVRSRLGHNGEMAAARRAAARAGCLRVMAASPCHSTLQQHDELIWHMSEYHAPVHGKKSEQLPIASKPAIKKSRRDSAAKPRSGRVAAESQASSEQLFHGSYPKRNEIESESRLPRWLRHFE